jgi:hypothetical protein
MGAVLMGVLSGLIMGTLAVLLRRFAGAIILIPVALAPLGYFYVWRDALLGPCFFATGFDTPACEPFRDFLALTLNNAADGVIFLVTYLVVAFVTFLALCVARKTIAKADMTSPAQKERRRQAQLRLRQARAELRARLEAEKDGVTRALEAAQRRESAS